MLINKTPECEDPSRRFRAVYNRKKIALIFIAINILTVSAIAGIKFLYEPPQILVNQIGYLPDSPKIVQIKTQSLLYAAKLQAIAENGSSQIMIPDTFPLIYRGQLWGAHYYEGNISSLTQERQYRLRLETGWGQFQSVPFVIGKHVYDHALERGYQFFYYQRSNCEVGELIPGYAGHALDHMDDGIFVDGIWRDLYGGWFSAGDYNKHNQWGGHIFGVIFSSLYAYEHRPELFNAQDRYNTAGQLIPDGIPDILNEAQWGLQYGLKCIMPNGSIIGSFEGDMRMSSPEKATDQIIGTADDRRISESHPWATADEAMWLAAGMAKMACISQKTNYFQENQELYRQTAINIYANHAIAYNFSNSYVSPTMGAPLLSTAQDLAGLEALDGYGNGNWTEIANWTAYAMKNAFYHNNQLSIWDDLGFQDRAAGLIVDWAFAVNTTTSRMLAYQLMERRWQLLWEPFIQDPLNFFSLPKIYSIEHNPAREIFFKRGLGMNSLYLYTAFALTQAIRATNGAFTGMIEFRNALLNWIFGTNPEGICMMEGVGSKNLPAYHHRYMYIPANPRGAVPGAIPNGYHDRKGDGIPYLDLQTAAVGSANIHNINFNTNEPWLPHNVACMIALSMITSM
jgi:hypothetical protein